MQVLCCGNDTNTKQPKNIVRIRCACVPVYSKYAIGHGGRADFSVCIRLPIRPPEVDGQVQVTAIYVNTRTQFYSLFCTSKASFLVCVC